MPIFEDETLEEMVKKLHKPGPGDREYGHRGKITASAIQAGRETVRADDWATENDGTSSQDNTAGVTR
jgi:hypothetical protein